MRAVLSLPLTCVVVLAVGCSSDPAPPEIDQGIESDAGGQTLDGSMVDGSNQADYPPGPYGQSIGSIIKDYKFQGVRDPAAQSFVFSEGQGGTVEDIYLHDFYNPTKDATRARVLMMTWSALWCPVCKTQASDIKKNKLMEAWRPKGGQMMELIFEDDTGEPAVMADVQWWAKTYTLDFPAVLDPEVQCGIYFDQQAAPYNMVIDLSNMKITYAAAGGLDSAGIEGEFTAVTGR